MKYVMAALFFMLAQGATADMVAPPNDGLITKLRSISPLITPQQQSLCAEGYVEYYRIDGPACAPAHSDAGQACADALDCDGMCLGDTDGVGVCSAGPLSTGCTDFLDPDGKAISICIE